MKNNFKGKNKHYKPYKAYLDSNQKNNLQL